MRYFSFVLFALLLIGCNEKSSGVHTGTEYIHNPDLSLFDAEYRVIDEVYDVVGSFESRIRSRTEYIYEDFVLSFPTSLATETEYPLDNDGVNIRYTKGGQAGQMTSSNAMGVFNYRIIDDQSIEIELQAEFSDFGFEGYVDPQPSNIIRTGTVSATLQ